MRYVSAFVLALVVVSISGLVSARSQDTRVAGLAVTPREGYVTLTWRPVAGATEYQIERNDVLVGLWRPNRQIRQQSPAFADAGFVPGGTLRWRVRAVVGGTPQEWSLPVSAQTRAPFGPAEFRTGFESRDGADYTTYEEEIDWTKRIVAASPRVRVVPLGTTPQGRTMNLFVIGHPAPKGSVQEIASGSAAGANCNVHGNEPSGREGCLMMIRTLAFSNDPAILDILTNATILIVPSFNADGRANNTRGNSAGQDLNRDHARLTQPESQIFARFLRDYTPEVMVDGHEYGSATTCDLPLLWPRHTNTAKSVHDISKTGLVEGQFYDAGATDGWWPCPYPPRGIDGAQTFTRVTGLKNMVTTLVEARSGGGPTRPAEAGNVAENRRRKAYSQLWSIQQALVFHRANRPAIDRRWCGLPAIQHRPHRLSRRLGCARVSRATSGRHAAARGGPDPCADVDTCAVRILSDRRAVLGETHRQRHVARGVVDVGGGPPLRSRRHG
jgi:hypothetical protein